MLKKKSSLCDSDSKGITFMRMSEIYFGNICFDANITTKLSSTIQANNITRDNTITQDYIVTQAKIMILAL